MTDSTIPLHAAFFEAVSPDFDSGDTRVQWFLPPAGFVRLGAQISPSADGSGRFIKRRMGRPNHRARWQLTHATSAGSVNERLIAQLEQYASLGWDIREPVVIRLDSDDYCKLWSSSNGFETPYRALRHVEAVTKKRGYRLV